jgi:hypothetical protein
MAASNRFEQNAAKCVRLAEGANDFVLSAGFMKMAEAWRDLAARRTMSQGNTAARPGSRELEAPNRRTLRHKRRKGAKAGTKLPKAA